MFASVAPAYALGTGVPLVPGRYEVPFLRSDFREQRVLHVHVSVSLSLTYEKSFVPMLLSIGS